MNKIIKLCSTSYTFFFLVNYDYFPGYLPNYQLTLLSVDPTKLTMEKSI